MTTTSWIVLTVFTAVGSALISGIFALAVAARNIKVENITKERTKWRDKIRCLADQIYDAATDAGSKPEERRARLEKLALALKLNLNPLDPMDIEIRTTVQDIMNAEPSATLPFLRKFGDQLALLLKHDWSRAKNEAGWFPDYEQLTPTQRISYADYRFKDR